LDSREGQGSESQNLRVFYAKLIMLAIVPLVIICTSYVVWLCIFFVQGKYSKKPQDEVSNEMSSRDQQTGRVISTIIIVLFLIHPTITTIMFNAFK